MFVITVLYQLNSLHFTFFFIDVTYFLLLILAPFNGTEMASYVLMCRKETAHSLIHDTSLVCCGYALRSYNSTLCTMGWASGGCEFDSWSGDSL